MRAVSMYLGDGCFDDRALNIVVTLATRVISRHYMRYLGHARFLSENT
jgi:hypothetical protein